MTHWTQKLLYDDIFACPLPKQCSGLYWDGQNKFTTCQHNLDWQEVLVIHPPLDHNIGLLNFHKGFLVRTHFFSLPYFTRSTPSSKFLQYAIPFNQMLSTGYVTLLYKCANQIPKNVDMVLPLSGKPGSWRNPFQNLQRTFPLPDRLNAWELKPLAATSGNNYWISTVYIACITWWFLWVIISNRGRAVSKSCSAPNTVLPNRAGGQYRTIDLPKMLFVGSGPLQSRQKK
jgi:hypothetical protein